MRRGRNACLVASDFVKNVKELHPQPAIPHAVVVQHAQGKQLGLSARRAAGGGRRPNGLSVAGELEEDRADHGIVGLCSSGPHRHRENCHENS